MGRWGVGAERGGGGTVLEAAGEKREKNLKRCLSRSQEKEGNKSEKSGGSRMEGGTGEKERGWEPVNG